MLRKATLSMAFHSLNLVSQHVDVATLIMCISVGSKGNFKVPFRGGRIMKAIENYNLE